MTNQEYADEIQKKEDIILSLEDTKRELLDNWTKYLCPIKIGETLIGNDYSFEGRKFVVEEIGITDGWTRGDDYKYKWKWFGVGRILNKNGTVGKRFTRHTMAVADVKMEEK